MPTTSKQGRCPNRQTSSTFVYLEPFRVTSILQLGVRLGDSTSFFFTQMGKPWYLINPNISCARTVSTNGHVWKAMVQSIGVRQFRFVAVCEHLTATATVCLSNSVVSKGLLLKDVHRFVGLQSFLNTHTSKLTFDGSPPKPLLCQSRIAPLPRSNFEFFECNFANLVGKPWETIRSSHIFPTTPTL